MIACLGTDSDLAVYFESSELPILKTDKIEGRILRVRNLREQGNLRISIDPSRATDNGRNIGVKFDYSSNPFEVDLFLSNFVYDELISKGRIGLRYGTRGSKVSMYDRAKLERIEKIDVETLEFYRSKFSNPSE